VRLSAETGIVEFLSRPRNAAADWSLNARGIAARSPIAEQASRGADESGRIAVPRAKVYEVSRGLGFDYGPTFQRVRHVSFPHPKRGVAILDKDPGVTIAGQTVDITGLDAAFHSLFATEEAGVADMPMKRMLPVRFGRVRAFAPGTMAARTVSRTLRQSLSSIVADIELVDETGRLVLLAETVRVIEAPVAAAVDPRTLTYRTARWHLERPGEPSVVALPGTDVAPNSRAAEAAAVNEALLLLEAGCLRAAWEAFHDGDALVGRRNRPPETEAAVDWPTYLCSSLLWHLETKGLVSDDAGQLTLADNCSLPAIDSVVRTLTSRHPTMAAEAAGLARIGEVVARLVAGDQNVHGELDSAHWRQIESASRQVSLLRAAALEKLKSALARAPADRLVRVLAIGAEHAHRLAEFLAFFANAEAVVTDPDPDRVEQARAVLGDAFGRLRCAAWSEVENLPAASFDLAIAIDGLSEIAATGDGLERMRRLLRPQAPLIAAEPSPSAFWDVVRGVRATWWSRSASADFPVGALLTEREWVDELATAGFTAVDGSAVLGDVSIGVMIQGLAGRPSATADDINGDPHRWEGARTAIGAALQERLLPGDGGHGAEASANPPVAGPPSRVAWIIDASRHDAVSAAYLGDLLTQLAERCAKLAASPAPLSVIVTFDQAPAGNRPDGHPLWCAVTAALRVAQNEYPALEIRCLSVVGRDAATIDSAALELMAPGEEREVWFQGGKRFVFRIEHGLAADATPRQIAAGKGLRLVSRSGTSRGSLAWTSCDRTPPGEGEVEIEVAAIGLNFRDVMWNLGLLPEEALEDGYAGAQLGMECAGTISAVGSKVDGLTVGDRVVAFVSGGFASHVVAPAFAVSALPSGLTFEAAATLPVAYLTAYYSLVHLAGLKRGETVLVHGGAGAVGLAALAVARHCGARVISTAGSDEKRALLRDLGADAVLNSRTLTFADEVVALTQGKGVDVVLNSLVGEAMIRSMDCLRPFGRFVELGKRDFYANTHLGLRPFRRNLAFFGVDIDQLIVEHRDLTQRLFAELVALFSQGDLAALPHRVFEGERIGEAFRLIQRSGHIGKIVVHPPAAPTDLAAVTGRFPVDASGLHLVIGGTGGFGLATAAWLADRGARRIVLASRTGTLSPEAEVQVDTLRKAGVEMRVMAVDVTDGGAVQRFLRNAEAQGKIKGIVHAAMVLDDRLMEGMDREAIEAVLQPKVAGALHLADAAASLSLDYLLLYSSATTLLGNPGQFNYVAANAFLEGLAQQMQRQAVPALAVAWGGIEDAGYLSRNLSTNASLRKRFSSSLLAARTALEALDLACDAEGRLTTATLAIARIDWAMAKRELAVVRGPCFGNVALTVGARQSSGSAINLEKLRAMPLEQASEALLEVVVEEIARVLRLPPKEVDRHRPLAEIGMDSLMMLELRTTVEESLQVDLPIMSLANGITPADVARRIATLVVGDAQQSSVTGTLAALSSSHLSADVEAMDPAEREVAARVVIERTRRIEGPL
ncbi:MAG: SDR family NAD(P)-dependent oxidoreductase, partial [Alphaproteobacteria bacterium]|nr:SDR family NAD(P)-dependent oxidoreductase [Alphaproteobacteria bacterium]